MADHPSDGILPSGPNRFLRSWAWKREHRPDKARFQKPYLHRMADPATGDELVLTIGQARFREEGFASTVWDSSIVMAKFFERWAHRYAGKKCLDLSAGCGLVGIVLSRLGAHVTCTDLGPNLPFLKRNCDANTDGRIAVRAHEWGGDVDDLCPPYDVVVACDVMYIPDIVGQLVASLARLSAAGGEVFVCHGRNRSGEDAFLLACAPCFDVLLVPRDQLDDVYQAEDISVLRLERR